MDKLSKATKNAKIVKKRFKEFAEKDDGTWLTYGPTHISQKDYGVVFDSTPYTNKYAKKVKQELKREIRAAKRSDKQDVRKQIDKILLEQE